MSSKNQKECAVLTQRLNSLFQEERARGTSARSILLQLGMSETALAEWNRGKSKPTIGAVVTLARYFNVSADYLLGLTDEPKQLIATSEELTSAAIIERPIADLAEKYKHLFTDEEFMKIAKVYEAAQDVKVKGLLVGYFIAVAKASGVDTTVVGY